MKISNFIIIGVIKGGTSGLYWTLAQHPSIASAKVKELGYFFKEIINKEEYQKLFPTYTEGQIIGEATPNYILHESVAKNIKKLFPDTKIIVLLRNPIDRAYSQYYHALRNYKNKLCPKLESFEIMIDKEYQNKSTYRNHMGTDLIKRGYYAKQLEMWFKYFPREQFKIIKSENYFKNSYKILKEIYTFLGLNFYKPKEIINPDKRTYPTSMNLRTWQKLSNHFKAHNEKLFKLINRTMQWE